MRNFGTNVFYLARYPIITKAKGLLAARRRNRKVIMEDYEYLREHMTLAKQVGRKTGARRTCAGATKVSTA